MAGATERQLSEFKPQELANTAWAFATSGEPAPSTLNPISVLDAMEEQGAKPQAIEYKLSMHGLGASGQIEAGFALLAQVEANGLLSH